MVRMKISVKGSRKRPAVAIQGEKGAFSELAARQLLGPKPEIRPCEKFLDVFNALKAGLVQAAVIPIENTLHGSVHENYDHLLKYEMPIVGETNVRIVHNLIAPAGVNLAKVRRVYSHPVALNQCIDYLAAHPQWELVPFYDTAGSVKMLVTEGLKDAAAIASSAAAENYGGKILKRSIEDDRQNFTRFFLLGDMAPIHAKSPMKISIVFATRNAPGALFRSLSALALRDISLAKIESRPLRGKPWEYLFYVDFLGDLNDVNVKNALAHLGETADTLTVLGCYPRA
jgi:prephenate dehydratase